MARTSFGDERLLIDKTDVIQRKMVKLTESFGEISKLVRELHVAAGDPILVENLLKVRANIAPADTRLFTNIAELLKENSLKDTVVSPETLRALSAMPHEARSIAVAAVAAGQLSDAEKLQEIESFSEQLLDRRQKSAARERDEYLKGLAQALVPQAVEDFEQLVEELVEAIRDFIYIYQSQNSFEGLEFYSERDYASAHRDIRMLAGLVLADFEIIFGKVESFLNPPENDSQAGMLANACRALLRFVEGQFGRDGGLALDESNAGFSLELFDAVRYLCTWPTSEGSVSEAHKRPSKQLRVLEFGAGAGGMAIGLMAAGFQHIGLLENMNTRLNTLKANWPSWPIRKGLITEVSDEELKRHQGIDLLAGSIPGYSFARSSGPEGRTSDDNHFPAAVRAVRITRPRSFMFAIVESVTFAQHAAYLAEVCSDLTRLGYKVEQIRLVKNDFGIPIQGTQLLLVGVRVSESGTFIIPSLINPVRRAVSEVVEPALIKYETFPEFVERKDSYSHQNRYNLWAAAWRRCGSGEKLLPCIPVSTPNKSTLAAMLEAYIEGDFYRETPPQVGEVDDQHFRPRLTVSAIALLQGFPDEWSFEAELSGSVDMIAEAMPPILARAIGLSIYQALTGTRIDLETAIREPLIDKERIGRPRPERVSLTPKWYTASRILKAAKFMDREDELNKLNPDEAGRALDTYLEELVPMKRGKGAALSRKERAAVARIAAATRLQRDRDCFPTEDSYPTRQDHTAL